MDICDSILDKKDSIRPPKGKIYIGSGDFQKTGEHFVDLLKEKCGLKAHHQVLDVGCGIGRIAIPLTKYINNQGGYQGFDIVKKGINWCRANISSKYSHFVFKHIDLKNDLYNMTTDQAAKNFIFPYAENFFDLVILTSVFTHMMPEDVDNYLSQIERVLKPGGKCFATFFIINRDSFKLMNESKGMNFEFNKGHYFLMNENVKEANIAFEEEYLLSGLGNYNFQIDSVDYGYWSGRSKSVYSDFQDSIIFSKLMG
ncbi:MAG: methyltransferase domain-containing protein [Saprospiraceae bacterium]|jgi:ubiquinone/menaquinone biosynthesis C-methylase UbiE